MNLVTMANCTAIKDGRGRLLYHAVYNSTAVAPRWVPSDVQILQTAASFICGKSAAPDPRRHLIGGDDPLIKRNLDLF